MSLQIGEKAPSFKLFDSQIKEVKLEDFKGKKILILFFPLAFSSVCTKELCTIQNDFSQYTSLGDNVVAISVDSIFALAKFKEVYNLKFTLLSDFNKDVSQAFHAYYPEYFGMKGVSKRAAFVIDEEGIIKYAEVLESSDDLPDFEAIKQALQE
ncbi:MAG: redoxin domain-containing protein [Bacteroidota bacterium]|jgi:peroxiredoxin|nr:redoxin domain-containing protein [Bacteroidota bacterium]